MFAALAADKTRYGVSPYVSYVAYVLLFTALAEHISSLNKPRKDCNLWGLRLARLVNINRVLIYEDSGEY